MSDMFYWPAIDLIIWGLTSSYFSSLQGGNQQVISILLGSLLLWMVVWRSQYEISVNLLEDLWNKNLMNIFVAPLSFYEWIAAFYTLGIVKSIVSISFAAILAFVLYHTNFLQYNIVFVLYLPILIMFGWTLGMMISALVLRFGTRVQTLAWSFPYLVSPFAAIYYPIATLPPFARKIASIIPISYVFESGREYVSKGVVDYHSLVVALMMSVVLLILATIFLKKSFDKLLQKGLVSVY